MLSMRTILSFSALLTFLEASPVGVKQHVRRDWFPPYTSCSTCYRSTWTQGPECKTDDRLLSTISRVLNPPASAKSTYTPLQWCTDYLRQTDWSRVSTTSSGISTYTDWTITHLFVTQTDYDHPTSTMYCPIPSSGMECGWDSNTIAPIEQGEDWSIEHYYNSTECQQICLEHSGCRAYRLQDGNSGCEIFNVGLGKGAMNVRNPTPSGSQWWDRNCQAHIPTPCGTTGLPTVTPTATTTTDFISVTPPALSAAPSQPLVTSPPTLVPRAEPANIAKRDAPLPDYLSDLVYYWSSIYVAPACSCLISSALPATLSTSTVTITSWTSSTTVSSTYEDWFTVTETPRKTTLYVSID